MRSDMIFLRHVAIASLLRHFQAKNGLKLMKNSKICEIAPFQGLKIDTKSRFISLKMLRIDSLHSEEED